MTNITRDVRRSEAPAQAVKMDVDDEQILQQRQHFQAQPRQQQQQFDNKSAEVSFKEFEGKAIPFLSNMYTFFAVYFPKILTEVLQWISSYNLFFY